jgi:hypothetical protein
MSCWRQCFLFLLSGFVVYGSLLTVHWNDAAVDLKLDCVGAADSVINRKMQ